jgi:hypothetical protein
VADFTEGYRNATWEPIWEDFYCDWRELWFNQHVEPSSWIVGDMVIAAGGKGILFASPVVLLDQHGVEATIIGNH